MLCEMGMRPPDTVPDALAPEHQRTPRRQPCPGASYGQSSANQLADCRFERELGDGDAGLLRHASARQAPDRTFDRVPTEQELDAAIPQPPIEP